MKKVLVIIGAIVLIMGIVIIAFKELKTPTNDTIKDSKVILNERQKAILEVEGLSTNYDELTYIQKNAIQEIEEMLVYLENKYNETFVYVRYDYSKKELCALREGTEYDADANLNYYIYVTGDDSQENSYSDSYEESMLEVRLSEQLKKELENYWTEKVGEDFVLFMPVSDFTEYDENNLIGSASIESYVFIDSSTIDESKLESVANKYADWIKSKLDGGFNSTRIFVLEQDDLKLLTIYNYTDKFEKALYSRDVLVKRSGEIEIY